jgi:hypothetical protein
LDNDLSVSTTQETSPEKKKKNLISVLGLFEIALGATLSPISREKGLPTRITKKQSSSEDHPSRMQTHHNDRHPDLNSHSSRTCAFGVTDAPRVLQRVQ